MILLGQTIVKLLTSQTAGYQYIDVTKSEKPVLDTALELG